MIKCKTHYHALIEIALRQWILRCHGVMMIPQAWQTKAHSMHIQNV
ncbi:MAG: hypothetical protein IPO71_11905 [Nitrosomonas sp.]|nr:hypothetical protein [Nitrosomonas sp.]